ncbi:MAG: 2-succinyl-5-enolpyruvyl-6-hydroxy-3-cyclohexene-1-carboxylic-acid synthase [Alphaproteobacteria bacterium]|nr:2-succinyl-5-enolpyruvyl-6-hydroxy-3-cyclohexene-1-carboxylic-acid synthase [Alphaproteobacteria bacterium]
MSERNVAEANARVALTLAKGLCGPQGGAWHAVVSPGSRNTPVLLALHALAQAGQAELHVVVDERAAGFYALGLARASGRPVLLSCTSGSAGAHYLPAILEADHLGLPLIAITADRPAELQHFGANQTTRQGSFFGEHVRLSLDLSEPAPEPALGWVASLAAKVLRAATGPNPGPVHLNLPFREPLWPHAPIPLDSLPDAPRLHPGAPGRRSVAALRPYLAAERGLIVVGPREPVADDPLPAALSALSERLGWPVLADALSGLRFGTPCVLSAYDALLRDPRFAEAHRPEVVLRLGRLPTSKPLFTWLAKAPRRSELLIAREGEWVDPFHGAAELLIADETLACEALLAEITEKRSSSWRESWRAADAAAQATLHAHCQGPTLWEGAVARTLAEGLPPGAWLHVASSMPVRDLDNFAAPRSAPLIASSNRGVNGIDGTLATALGHAASHEGPHAVLLGDLATLHDLGALALLAGRVRHPVVLVILDNRGGRIFHHLPISKHPSAFEPLFLTPPDVDLPRAIAGCGVPVSRCEDLPALRAALASALARPGVNALYCPIDPELNLARHREVWEAVREH